MLVIIINYTNTLFQYLNKKCGKVLKALAVVFATYYNGVMDVSSAFSKVLLQITKQIGEVPNQTFGMFDFEYDSKKPKIVFKVKRYYRNM